MTAKEPDLWYAFVRTHRIMIREIERRLAAAGLPGYAWYDAAACMSWQTPWPSNAITSPA